MSTQDTAGTAREGMTMDDEMTRLRALLERATQTPWRQDGAEIMMGGSWTVIAECTLPDCLEVADEDREEQEERNASLIVAAVNALPGLLDAAERAERERDVLRAQQAPLVACVDALRAAATAAGWRDADPDGRELRAGRWAVIPAHGWGGRWARIGARPLLVGRSGWAILMSQPSHDTAPRDMSESGAAKVFVEAAPDDACLMSAGGLIEALAPSLGESCTVCDDEGERTCPCCLGKMTLACHNPACTEAHVCEACSVGGRIPCQCRPSDSVVAVIRGARFGAGMMLPLRRVLAVVDPDAPVSVWTAVGVPLADGRGLGTALVVDIEGTRYALAERVHGEDDELHEVTL